jgi:hypothetical protein
MNVFRSLTAAFLALPSFAHRAQARKNQRNPRRSTKSPLFSGSLVGDSNDALGTVIGVALAANALSIRATALADSLMKIVRETERADIVIFFMPTTSA